MNSSPTLPMPIRSRAAEALRGSARTTVAALIAAGVLSVLAPPASTWAHEAIDETVPTTPGMQLGAGLALSTTHARDPWPATRLPGVFNSGNTPTDRRGGALEHATLDLGLRATAAWTAALALGWHDSDPLHVEAAWVQWEHAFDDSALRLRAGRQAVPMGRVVGSAGHFDRFAATPLALRAVLDGAWQEDGLQLAWDRSHDGPLPALESVGISVWQPRNYPGSRDTAWAPALHARAAWGDGGDWGTWGFDGFAMRLEPRGRGAYVQNALSVHTHAAPDCNGPLTGITCFDGRSDVLVGSATWDTPWAGIRVQAAGLLRRDRGRLAAAGGTANYRGTTGGGWMDLVWPVQPQWTLALRGESVRSVQTVSGTGALAAATDAGLLGSTRIQRVAASATYEALPGLYLSLEAGTDRQGATRNRFTLLRLVWTPEPLWGVSW